MDNDIIDKYMKDYKFYNLVQLIIKDIESEIFSIQDLKDATIYAEELINGHIASQKYCGNCNGSVNGVDKISLLSMKG